MAKIEKPKPMDEALKKRLDDQDKQIDILLDQTHQVMQLLKGSELLNYPGLINVLKETNRHLNEIDKTVQHMERWRQVQIAKKGTFTFKTADILTKCLTVFGAISLLAGTIYTIIQIIDLVSKQKTL